MSKHVPHTFHIRKIVTLIVALNAPLTFASGDSGFGWQELPDTNIKQVCPEDNFNGYEYTYSWYCRYVTLAWNSAVLDTDNDTMFIWGGGHNDYYGNEVYSINFRQLNTQRLTDPAKPADRDADPAENELFPYDGTQPNSRHTYDGMAYLQHEKKIWAFSGALASKKSGRDNITWIFDPETNRWNRDNSTGDIPQPVYGAVSGYDPVSQKVFLHDRTGFYEYSYSPAGGNYKKLLANDSLGLGINAAINPDQRTMLVIGGGHQALYYLDGPNQGKRADIPAKGAAAIVDGWSPGLAYNSKTKRFYGWFGDGRLYEQDPETLEWRALAYKNGPGPQLSRGTFGRFVYSPSLDAFLVYNAFDQNAYTLRLYDGIDSIAPSAPQVTEISAPYPDSLRLSWAEATDNVGVAGYRVYRDGTLMSEQSETIYKEMNIQQTDSGYQVVAFDSAGNESNMTQVNIPAFQKPTPQLKQGDCDTEPQLDGRSDIVLCESWDDDNWWQEKGYLSDPIVNDPRDLKETHLENTAVVSEGCIQGNCLAVTMHKGQSGALSAYWPLINANIAPDNLFLRYYIKLGDQWDPNMCNSDGERVGAGGKFPGLADVRTWADPGGQCGNGGEKADGKSCWSARSLFRDCYSGDGTACSSKPAAATRFGTYLYHPNQSGATGDHAIWDNDDWGQFTGEGGTCSSESSNVYCGKTDNGVFERGVWYLVEMQIKMNTPGKSDGELRGWVNSQLSYEKTNMEFRSQGHDFLHNRLLWLNVYKGGVQGNCETANVYLDQLVLSLDNPVGSLEGATVFPPSLQLTADTLSVSQGDPISTQWHGENIDSCTASGIWEGSKTASGSEILYPTKSGYATLNCTGSGGAVIRQLEIIVDNQPVNPPSNEPTDPGLPGGGPSVSPPSNLQLVNDANGGVSITWDVSDDSEIEMFNVYLMGTLVKTLSEKRFDANLPLYDTPLLYTVTAIDSDGNESQPSETLQVILPGDSGDSSLLTLLPSADAMLSSSTYRNQGAKNTMDVSRGYANSVIRFPVEVIPSDRSIRMATLKLHSVEEYGTTYLRIFRTDSDWGENTVTREYANSSLKVKWQNLLGDWQDREGVTQGDQALAEAVLLDDDTPNQIEIDITEIVQQWQNQELNNYGLILNATRGTNYRFATKEHEDPNWWPKLEIEFAD
ncbi:MAG: DNRLRE domain-containing protein [Pseudomonadales bacterium]|nr:DNRLRE domain-containing protein [Pseudomonadales bacterium]